MLVLSRKRGERIVIGQDIEVTILEVCGGRVRLGIQAPMEVSIQREELLKRIQESEVVPAIVDGLPYDPMKNPNHVLI
jgi:carbon storage regulator